MGKPRIRLLLVFLALALATSAGVTGDAAGDAGGGGGFFRVEDLRPGMKGVGKTCFQGTEPEDFEVEVLGLLRNENGPGEHLVMARFGGEKLARTRVFSGMSGSPVFIDGKLLGAVAFAYAYSTEPIGYITPITQMVAAVEGPKASPEGTAYKTANKKSRLGHRRLPLPSSGAGTDVFPSALPGGRAAATGGEAGGMLPIPVPVSLGGFDPRTVDAFAPAFRQTGMTLVKSTGRAGSAGAAMSAQGAGEAGQPGAPPFRPGDNIVVSLVEGDLEVSGCGTVTWVDGDRLYAFGHPLEGLGPVELPMHKAAAFTVVPRLSNSFKECETGAAAGVLRQDRNSGIFGMIGAKPRLMPLRVRLVNSRGAEKTFSFGVARDAVLTAYLVALVLNDTIVSSEREQGALTVGVRGKIHVKGQPDVALDNRFSSDTDAAYFAALSVALPVDELMAPGYPDLEIEGIDLEIAAAEKDQSAALESVRLDRTEARAGETVELTVSCMRADGAVARQRYPVKIPETASPGRLSLMVADGSSLTLQDELDSGGEPAPRDLGQTVRRLNETRKGDRLYARFFRREAGAVLGGEKLPGLPPTILSILNSSREAGSVGAVRSSTLAEYELPATELLPAGSAVLELTIKAR